MRNNFATVNCSGIRQTWDGELDSGWEGLGNVWHKPQFILGEASMTGRERAREKLFNEKMLSVACIGA